jgi:hypothetical protein
MIVEATVIIHLQFASKNKSVTILISTLLSLLPQIMKLSVAILALAPSRSAAQVKPFKRLIEWSEDFENPDEGAGAPQNILGGTYTKPGSRPWLVPVVGKYFCGGSLISPSAVMTCEFQYVALC